jgi:hypothetical protein
MKKSIGDIFLVIGVFVGLAAGAYAAYFVWTMNWGTGSRNFGIGVGMLVFLPMAAFGISLFVLGLIGSYLEDVFERWRR